MNNRKKEHSLFLIRCIPLFIIMIAIFLFSAMPSGESDTTSHAIADPIARLLQFFTGEASAVEMANAVNWVVRKIAHGFEYMLLAISAIAAFEGIVKKRWKLFCGTELFCFLYAITDEIHQYFVPGRYMAAIDVVIDSMGAFVGVLLCICYFKIKQKT